MLLMNRLAPLSAFASRAQVMSSPSSSVSAPVSADTQRSGKVVFENPTRHKDAFFNFLAKHLTGQSFKSLGKNHKQRIQSLALTLRTTKTLKDMAFHPVKDAYFSLGGNRVTLPEVNPAHNIIKKINTLLANINRICNG
jgi:hypothetical protein